MICGGTFTVAGSMTMKLEESGGTARGQADITLTETKTGKFGDAGCGTAPDARSANESFSCPVAGGSGSLACSVQRTSGTATVSLSFSGSLAAGVISGSLTYARNEDNGRTTGSTTFPITLR